MRRFYITVVIKHDNIPLAKNMLGYFPDKEAARKDAVEWAATSNIVKWGKSMTTQDIEKALLITVEETE